jgi:hypothetical protein
LRGSYKSQDSIQESALDITEFSSVLYLFYLLFGVSTGLAAFFFIWFFIQKSSNLAYQAAELVLFGRWNISELSV